MVDDSHIQIIKDKDGKKKGGKEEEKMEDEEDEEIKDNEGESNDPLKSIKAFKAMIVKALEDN